MKRLVSIMVGLLFVLSMCCSASAASVTNPAVKYDGHTVKPQTTQPYDLSGGSLVIEWNSQSAADHYSYKCIGLYEEPAFGAGNENQSANGTVLVEKQSTTLRSFTVSTTKMKPYPYLKIAVAAYDSNGTGYWTTFGVQLTNSSASGMTLSDSSLTFRYSGDSDVVQVSGASSFTISYPTQGNEEKDRWLTATKSGSSILISARANYGASTRSETITVRSSDGQTQTITVTQKKGYSAPTASIRVGSTQYSSGATYGPLANDGDDVLYLRVDVKNARHIYVDSGNTTMGHKDVAVTGSSSVTSHSCDFRIPAGIAPGTYTFTVYVSNSDVSSDKWAQSIEPIKLNVTVVANTPNASFNPIWPCQSAYKVSCVYYYKDPYKGSYRHSTRYGINTAIDITGGGSIVAVEDGIVTTLDDLGTESFGKYIVITHDNGKVTLYAHLSSFAVSKNSRVTKGQVIGTMGNTGNSKGVHLHFEMQGKNPLFDYYLSKYKAKISFHQNVYTNNMTHNSDKRICSLLADEYSLGNDGWYRYKGNADNSCTHTSCTWKTKTAASCTAEGLEEYVCNDCGAVTNSRAIAKAGHTAGSWVVITEATETSTGLKRQSCTACGATLSEEVIPVATCTHANTSWIVTEAATCTANGVKALKCNNCGTITRTETITANGHTAGSWVVITEATETSTGLKRQSCTACGATLSEEVIPVAACTHANTSWVVTEAATCTANGVKALKCNNCGTITRTETITANGHTAGSWVVITEATETSTGLKRQSCTACGATLSEEVIPVIASGNQMGNITFSAGSGLTGKAGGTVTVPISIKNPDNVALGVISLGFNLPAGVTINEVVKCGVASNATVLPGNPILVSEMNNGIAGSGKIVEVTLALDSSVVFPAKIEIKPTVNTLAPESEHTLAAFAATITNAPARIPGDVTSDGKVTTADFLRLGKYLAGWDDITLNSANADVTGDGKITTADFLRLGKYLAGWDVALQ